jgi:hypothetical protein
MFDNFYDDCNFSDELEYEDVNLDIFFENFNTKIINDDVDEDNNNNLFNNKIVKNDEIKYIKSYKNDEIDEWDENIQSTKNDEIKINNYKKYKELFTNCCDIDCEDIDRNDRLNCLCKNGECLEYRRIRKKKISDYCSLKCQDRCGNLSRKKKASKRNFDALRLRKTLEKYICERMNGEELKQKRNELKNCIYSKK